ncbi:TPA: phage tail protein [Klebsiella pneumoniae]
MVYATIHTSYGLKRLAQAESTGVPIKLIEMAVGNGNGNDTEPGALAVPHHHQPRLPAC